MNLLPTRPQNPVAPMTVEEIYSWIANAKVNAWYKSQLPVNDGTLARVAGLRLPTIRNFIKNGRMSQESARIMTNVIEMIVDRRVIWIASLPIKGRQGPPKGETVYLTPPTSRPIIARWSEESDWTIFARCRSCGNDKWLPVKVAEKACVVCYSCFPKSQWPTIGAVGVDRNMIAEYINKQKGP